MFRLSKLSFATLAAACAASACEPDLDVGEWTCPGGEDGTGGRGGPNDEFDPTDPVTVPWSTSFENGFCDYARASGFCYVDPKSESKAEFSIVTSPVHTGKHAAAFRVRGDDRNNGSQTRCVRQGVFPREAYYSAWYFIPEVATNTGLWNLFHFQGGEGPGPQELPGMWDVSIGTDDNDELRLFLYDFLDDPEPTVDAFPPIPIGEWFKIEVFFRRAADETGELAVFQDSQLVFRATDLITDSSTWGQWYVGNLADALMPPDSTVYVDDVSISTRR